MDAAVKDSVKNITPEKLRWNRVQIYKVHVMGGVPSVFLRINGRPLKPALVDNRGKNFRTFVKMYFYNGKDGSTDKLSDNFGYPFKLKKSSLGYRAFERYAKTDYGSSVIKEIISQPKKFKDFTIRQSTGLHPKAKADYLVIHLPEKFPSMTRFEIGRQNIFDLAIIHHEFAHTMLVRSITSKKITIKDELWAVRKAENPVRLKRGNGRYEPRYVYYNGKQTVNIITGKSLPLRWTVSKYDPRIMVKLDHKDAL